MAHRVCTSDSVRFQVSRGMLHNFRAMSMLPHFERWMVYADEMRAWTDGAGMGYGLSRMGDACLTDG
eukprot:scaffold268251_cov37-Tisochrysis_lutea.AAC.2